MQAKWLLETDVYSENLTRLAEEVRRQGMEVQIASHVPFEDERGYLGLFEPGDCVVYYGSLNFASQVKREAAWVPGVYHNVPAYECSHYYPALAGYDLLNADYAIIPYGDLVRQKEFLLAHLGEQDCVFIRPNTGSKVFAGKLVCRERFEKDVAALGSYGAPPHELCVVAPPRNVESEWRFIVVEGRVITGSQYVAGGKVDVRPGFPDEALALAQRVATSGYDPDPVWCVDICRTQVGNYYLLEIGCFSCAGLYACDLEVVVREVSALALEQWREAHAGRDSPEPTV